MSAESHHHEAKKVSEDGEGAGFGAVIRKAFSPIEVAKGLVKMPAVKEATKAPMKLVQDLGQKFAPGIEAGASEDGGGHGGHHH